MQLVSPLMTARMPNYGNTGSFPTIGPKAHRAFSPELRSNSQWNLTMHRKSNAYNHYKSHIKLELSRKPGQSNISKAAKMQRGQNWTGFNPNRRHFYK
jgi:hypothetical protein